jgi:hypothetical protein
MIVVLCFSTESLDELEFGEEHEYVEDAIPAAEELGLVVSFSYLCHYLFLTVELRNVQG